MIGEYIRSITPIQWLIIIFVIVVITIVISSLYKKEEFTYNPYMNLIEPQIDYNVYNPYDPLLEMEVTNNALNEIEQVYQKEHPFNTSMYPENLNPVKPRLTNLQKVIDQEEKQINNVRKNNIENFARFELEVAYQNPQDFEGMVDKIAQVRTQVGGTDDYSKFGNDIWTAFDNLMSNPFTPQQTTTNPNYLIGVGNDTMSPHYLPLQSIDYSVNNQILG